jgi:hypothetical protein
VRRTVVAAIVGVPVGLGVAWMLVPRATATEPRKGTARESGPLVGTVGKSEGAKPQAGTAEGRRPMMADDDVPGVIDDHGPLVRDPRAPGYDGARLVFGAFHGYADALWKSEPRLEPWAGRREASMIDYSRDDVAAADPDARVEVDCHASTCRVRVFSDSPFFTEEMGPYPFSCMGKLAMFGESELDPERGRYTDYYVVFHERAIGDDGFAAYRDRWCPPEQAKWRTYVQQPYPR